MERRSHVVVAYPAGDESDGSNDEWDIGYSSNKKTAENKASEVDAVVENDVSRLKQAISKADIQTVEQLLDQGVDVETRLAFEWTPLMCAVNLANHDMAELLLDRGASANFSTGQFTVLMAGCTASSSEDAVLRCVELLLSRHADPNTADRAGMSCLMQAARDGCSKLINLLVSYGAQVNTQDSKGYTALALATQYGRVAAALTLLQLGADRTVRTHEGASAADIAEAYKHAELTRILTASGHGSNRSSSLRSSEGLAETPRDHLDGAGSKECPTKLGELELFLHGLKLGYLADIMTENDVTWGSLLTIDGEELEKLGVTDPEDRQKVLQAVQEMVLERVDLDSFKELHDTDNSNEEFYSFLISLQQQCSYLTDTVRGVSRRFPQRASEMVFSLDPTKEAQAVCSNLLLQTVDLQREVSCLYSLLSKLDRTGGPCRLSVPHPHGNRRRWLLPSGALGVLGVLLLWVYKVVRVRVSCGQSGF